MCLGLSRRGIWAACAARLPFLPMAAFPAWIKTSTRRSKQRKKTTCAVHYQTHYRYLATISCCFLIFGISDCAFPGVVQTAHLCVVPGGKGGKGGKDNWERVERRPRRPKVAKARPARLARQRLAARARKVQPLSR